MYKRLLILLLLVGFLPSCIQPSQKQESCSIPYDEAAQELIDSLSVKIEKVDSVEVLVDHYYPTLSCLNISGESEKDSSLASLYDSFGRLLLDESSLLPEARHLFNKSLQIRKQLYQDVPHRDKNRMYYNIGATYLNNRREGEGIAYFDSAAMNIPADFGIISLYSNLRLGQSYEAIGERENAMIYYQKAQQDAIEYEAYDLKLSMAKSFSRCAREMDLYAKGVEMATETLREIPEDEYYFLDYGDLLLELGNVWQDSLENSSTNPYLPDSVNKYYDKAIEFYSQSKSLDSEVRDERISLVIANKAELLRKIGKEREAIKLLSPKIESKRFHNLPNELKAQFFLNRGESALDLHLYEEAQQDFQNALNIIVPETAEGENVEVKTALLNDFLLRDYQILTLSNMARAQIAISEEDPQSLSSAITIYDSLTSFIHRYRADLISEEAKMGLSGNIQKSLENAFSTAISLYKLTQEKEYLEQAFYFSEERKAFTLLEATRLNQFHDLLDEDDREKEQALEKEQARLRTALQVNEGNPKMKELIQDSIAENFKQVGAFNEYLKKNYPKYHQLKTRGADLSVAQIQQELLENDQAMLEYYYTPEKLYLFFISQNELQLREVSLENIAFEETLRAFKGIMSAGVEKKEVREEEMIGELGHQLYELLIAPVAALLPERVMIIPDKELNTFPFEALVKKEGLSTPGDIADEEQFLIFDHSLAYCFSANLWWQMHQIQPRNTSKLALINCEFNSDLHKNKQPQAKLGTLASSKKFLKPLGRAQVNEMEGIEEKAGRVKRVDEASKEDFLSLCEKYGRIHLATHGIVHKSQQQLNFISFSQSADTLNADQLLFLKDLLPYNWEMDFVFLSACQTASGEFIEGEGNMSLARGLAYAGVKSFVTTLWDVPTQPKADLVPRFYDHLLNDDVPKDVALQKAKMEVVYKYPHPANWAGFSLSGSF